MAEVTSFDIATTISSATLTAFTPAGPVIQLVDLLSISSSDAASICTRRPWIMLIAALRHVDLPRPSARSSNPAIPITSASAMKYRPLQASLLEWKGRGWHLRPRLFLPWSSRKSCRPTPGTEMRALLTEAGLL